MMFTSFSGDLMLFDCSEEDQCVFKQLSLSNKIYSKKADSAFVVKVSVLFVHKSV